MKYSLFTYFVLLSFTMNAQLNKKYFAYINPISTMMRNPTLGLEGRIKNAYIHAIQLEASYQYQDHKMGRFLAKGYEQEKSNITDFESYPKTKIPIYVYNGTTLRLGMLKYLYTKNINQYLTLSTTVRSLGYDSLKIEYNNTPRIKKENILDRVASFTHHRYQHEKLKSVGIGIEYGLRKSYSNIIFNFFVRPNWYYTRREITSYNEEFNKYFNGDLVDSISTQGVQHYTIKTLQFRPQIGIRIGLTNF